MYYQLTDSTFRDVFIQYLIISSILLAVWRIVGGYLVAGVSFRWLPLSSMAAGNRSAAWHGFVGQPI